MRVIDTYEYVSMLKGLVEEGKEVNMIIAGSSMSPFLCHQRDTIWFKAPDSDLKAGDMVFYLRDNNQYVMHRICKVNSSGTYDIIGDAQTQIEHNVRRDQIFARITQVQRKGRILRPGNFWWGFFAKVWIHIIPLRPIIQKLYSIKYIFRKK